MEATDVFDSIEVNTQPESPTGLGDDMPEKGNGHDTVAYPR